MKRLLFIFALATIMLAACGNYEETPPSADTQQVQVQKVEEPEYHGLYSDDPAEDAAVQASIDMMLMSAALN
jgi:hypothetical protein